MKLAIHYIREMGIAINMQSIVSLLFFLLFIFIGYMILSGNKREYKEYGDLPLEDNVISDNFESQNKN